MRSFVVFLSSTSSQTIFILFTSVSFITDADIGKRGLDTFLYGESGSDFFLFVIYAMFTCVTLCHNNFTSTNSNSLKYLALILMFGNAVDWEPLPSTFSYPEQLLIDHLHMFC